MERLKQMYFGGIHLERFDEEGNLLGLEDENGKVYHFKTHKQFWTIFLNHLNKGYNVY
jgi:hypothetical protein